VHLVLVAHVVAQRAREDGVVRVGELVRDIVQQRAQHEAAVGGAEAAPLEPAELARDVGLGVFRVVAAQRAVAQRAAQIGQKIPVRLDAAEQKRHPVPPELLRSGLVQQKAAERRVIHGPHCDPSCALRAFLYGTAPIVRPQP